MKRHMIGVRMDDDLKKEIEKLAKKDNRTVSSFIRDILYRLVKGKKE